MANTPEGGRKTADKLRERDPDYYKKIGKKGGSNSGSSKNRNNEK